MNRNELILQLKAFSSSCEQEEHDRLEILRLLDSACGEELVTRSFPSHLTASAWVVNPQRNRVLLAFHNIYGAWSWLGGHMDGCWNAAEVALREVQEESGLRAKLILPQLYSCEILTVDGHIKRGSYVSSHLHLNLTYLIEADDNKVPSVKPDENSAVSWFPLEKAPDASNEIWMREKIYRKLNAKLRTLQTAEL